MYANIFRVSDKLLCVVPFVYSLIRMLSGKIYLTVIFYYQLLTHNLFPCSVGKGSLEMKSKNDFDLS